MAFYTDKQQREIFHLLFLERLFRLSDPHVFSLKGGVNLRFFFQSPRYSEDMDIDVFAGSVETLKKNGYKILQDASLLRALQTYGIEKIEQGDPTKAKHTSTTQRFKVRLINNSGESFPTKVEFSRRKQDSENTKESVQFEKIPPAMLLPYKKMTFSVSHYNGFFAVQQKIQALGGRTEVQARDAFDLYILYLNGYFNQEHTLKLTTTDEREKALTALLSLDYDAYLGQVVEYLQPEHKKEYSANTFWNLLCDKLVEILDV